MSAEWIVVDDSDRNIHYSGSWASMQQDANVPKDAFQQTTHACSADASLSFEFDGTGVAVYGPYSTLNDTSFKTYPTWTCAVDGNTIPSNKAFLEFPMKTYCNVTALSDGAHTLTVNISTPSADSNTSRFWLDYIQYIPSKNLVVGDALVKIQPNDSKIAYEKAWSDLGPARVTFGPTSPTSRDPSLFMNFTGISFAWYGLSTTAIRRLNPSLRSDTEYKASGTYSIDNHSPIEFVVTLWQNSTDMNYNEKIFETIPLSSGAHNLTVYFQGGDTVPLTLDYFMVRNVATSAGTSGSTTSSALLGTSTSMPEGGPTSRKSSVGPIVGGAVGGVLAILLALIGVFLYRRRRQTNSTPEVPDSPRSTTPTRPHPFPNKSEKFQNPPVSPLSASQILPSSRSRAVTPFLRSSIIKSDPAISTAVSSHQGGDPTLSPITPFVDSQWDKPSSGSDAPSSSNASEPASGSSNKGQRPNPMQVQNLQSPTSPTPIPIPNVQGFGAVDQLVPDSASPNSAGVVSPTAATPRFVRHEDSGIRMVEDEEVVELPPLYTPS